MVSLMALDDDNFDRNRIYIGAIMPVRKGIDVDIYYMWQSSRSGDDWNNIEVIGTGLKFEF